jgi:hypothetical protein
VSNATLTESELLELARCYRAVLSSGKLRDQLVEAPLGND